MVAIAGEGGRAWLKEAAGYRTQRGMEAADALEEDEFAGEELEPEEEAAEAEDADADADEAATYILEEGAEEEEEDGLESGDEEESDSDALMEAALLEQLLEDEVEDEDEAWERMADEEDEYDDEHEEGDDEFTEDESIDLSALVEEIDRERGPRTTDEVQDEDVDRRLEHSERWRNFHHQEEDEPSDFAADEINQTELNAAAEDAYDAEEMAPDEELD